jgi:hypothetical protein
VSLADALEPVGSWVAHRPASCCPRATAHASLPDLRGLSNSNASFATCEAVEQSPCHLQPQAGDKTQAGSDQRFSAKSSDDDDGGTRNGLRPAGQGLEKPHHSGAAHVAAVADGAGGAGGGAGEGGADAPGGAFDRSKIGKLAKRPPAGPGARKGAARKGAAEKKPAKVDEKAKPSKARASRWYSSVVALLVACPS